jgi:hypothetical protein
MKKKPNIVQKWIVPATACFGFATAILKFVGAVMPFLTMIFKYGVLDDL